MALESALPSCRIAAGSPHLSSKHLENLQQALVLSGGDFPAEKFRETSEYIMNIIMDIIDIAPSCSQVWTSWCSWLRAGINAGGGINKETGQGV
eukprot:scaffold12183_cov68-Phaeocystis_antarctica.AAC.13